MLKKILSPPNYWYQTNLPKTFLWQLATPLLWLLSLFWFGLFTARQIWQHYFILPTFIKLRPTLPPILLVGNMLMGGTGKTPTIRALRQQLPKPLQPCLVMVKHYGRPIKWQAFPPYQHHNHHWQANTKKIQATLLRQQDFKKNYSNPNHIMDEALLHQQDGDVLYCQNRLAGFQLLARLQPQKKYRAILLDDGFQDFTFQPDLSLLLFDQEILIGNGKTLPLGPLRQNLQSVKKTCLTRPSFLLFGGHTRVRHNKTPQPPAQAKLSNGAKLQQLLQQLPFPYFFSQRHYQPCQISCQILGNQPTIKSAQLKQFTQYKWLSFAGIAHPNNFFTNLKNLGFTLTATKSFPDHYPYQLKDWQELQHLAQQLNCQLITTTKDAMRLLPYLTTPNNHRTVQSVALSLLELSVELPPKLITAISQKLLP